MPTGLSGITAALFTFPVGTILLLKSSPLSSLNKCPQPHMHNMQTKGQHIIAANMKHMFSMTDAIYLSTFMFSLAARCVAYSLKT